MRIFNRRVEGDASANYSVSLTYDKRVRGRLRITLDDGAGDAGIDIERGEVLHDGARLGSIDGTVLLVHAEPETVSVATTTDSRLFARACYHVGNRHAHVQIGEGELVYLADHVLDEMLRGLGLSITADKRAFDPESGAYSGRHVHTHTHANTHRQAD